MGRLSTNARPQIQLRNAERCRISSLRRDLITLSVRH
jgi:hypothetical protein